MNYPWLKIWSPYIVYFMGQRGCIVDLDKATSALLYFIIDNKTILKICIGFFARFSVTLDMRKQTIDGTSYGRGATCSATVGPRTRHPRLYIRSFGSQYGMMFSDKPPANSKSTV